MYNKFGFTNEASLGKRNRKPRIATWLTCQMIATLRKRGRDMDEVKEKIPADYQIPYFVHQDDMNKLDQSHKRVEKWLIGFAVALFIALVGTNAYWIWYEQSYQDVVVTENSQDGEGVNIMSGGDVSYGAENENSKNQSQKER